jgi:hypothetical protein
MVAIVGTVVVGVVRLVPGLVIAVATRLIAVVSRWVVVEAGVTVIAIATVACRGGRGAFRLRLR